MRLLRLMAWLRWRTFVNGLARRRKASSAQRMSRWADAGATVIVAAAGVLIALLVAAGGFAGGALLGSGPDASAAMGLAIRILGFSALGMALVSPLQGAGEGKSPVRLLLLPVSLRQLQVSGILSSLADPMVVIFAPALLAVVAGVAVGGGALPALVALPAALASIALLVGFDALVGFGSQYLLRDRRRGEAVALVLLLVVMALGFVPAMLAGRMDDSANGPAQPWAARPDVESTFGAFDALPPGLFARALQRAVDGRTASSLAHSAVLAAGAVACLAAAASVQARLLSEPGRSSRRRARGGFPEGRLRLRMPGVEPATLAVAAASARAALRTVRGKLATFTPPVVAGAMALVFRNVADEGSAFASTLDSSSGLFGWALALSLLNQQPLVLNSWAVDRAGFTLMALLPATDRQLVRGKMLSQALLLGLALAPAFAMATALGRPSSLAAWATVLLGAVAALLLHSPVAMLLSSYLPRAADMTKLSGQQPHGAASLIGSLSVVAAIGLPRLAAFLGSLAGGPWAGVAGMALACGGAALVAWLGSGLAADVLGERREAIAMAAQGR